MRRKVPEKGNTRREILGPEIYERGIVLLFKFRKLSLKKWWYNNQDFITVIVALLFKFIFFSAQIGLKPDSMEMLISSAAIMLILSGGFLLLPVPARRWCLIVFDLIISIMLLADLLFYRFFHGMITVPVLLEAGQVEGVSSSIANLFGKWDFLLFIDFAVLIPYFVILTKKGIKYPVRFMRRFGEFALILIVCGFVLNFNTKEVQAKFSDSEYTGLSWNQTVLRNLGVVNYHLFDLVSYIKKNNAKGSMTSAAPQIKAWMAQHSQQTLHNYTGVAKGKNVIIIQLEAMQNFLVGRSVNGQEVTPNLDKLMQTSMYFDNYFTQIGQGNTSDAEFASLNSLYSAHSGSVYVMNSGNTYQSLPWVLKGAGYQGSYAFHANTPDFWNRAKMFKAEGFSNFFNNSNFFTNHNQTVGMGLSDEAMYSQTVTKLQQLKQPFMSFTITLSGHYPYDIPKSLQSLNIPQGEYSPTFTNYLQAQHYSDLALGDFINQLKQDGLYDNSVLVVYGDHYGTGWTNQDLQKFLGRAHSPNQYDLMELNKVPLFIHLPGNQGAGVKHISGGQMDLYPTLLNLLGISRQNQFYFGQDLLNTQHGFSAFRVWAPDGSFATDDVFYIASWDGKFADGKAYNRKTGQEISLKGLRGDYDQAEWQLNASDLIISTDGLGHLININHGSS